MRSRYPALPYHLLRALPRRGRFRVALALKPGSTDETRAVTVKLRGGLVMHLDLCDHMQRAIAADCDERPEEDVTVGLLQPGDQVIDIGANVGHHSLRWARAVAPGGRVVAFEPAPPNYRVLLLNLALNPTLPVESHQVALGDREGSLAMSSDRPGATSGSYSMKSTAPGGFEVPQRTLDSWAADQDLSRLRLVKLDVEGWEAKVLDGAASTIAERRPYLMIEWNPGHGETGDLGRWVDRLTGELAYRALLIDRSPIAGRGTLTALPADRSAWPGLCNLLFSPDG